MKQQLLHLLALALCIAAAPAIGAQAYQKVPASSISGTLTPSQGGTGVANNNAATLTRSGNHAVTLTTTGTTNVTLPTSGTLQTVGGALGAASATSMAHTGTAGAGFSGFVVQSSAPTAPASGLRLYADATGRLSWIRQTDGFTRSFDATLTANRVWTMPDATATIAYQGGPLGTPSSGTLTSATGLPISTGVSGLGTGVAAALAVAAGTTNGVVLFGNAATFSSLTSSGTHIGALAPNSMAPIHTQTGTGQSVRGFAISPTYNQPSATSVQNSDLFINRTETSLGTTPGAQYLIDARVANVQKFSVDSTGLVSAAVGALTGDLTIGADAGASRQVIINGADANTKATTYKSAGVVKWQTYSAPTSHNFGIDSGSATALTITQAGAITMLGAVLMPALATNSAATVGTLCQTVTTGNITVNTTLACLSSSERYKQNIQPLNIGLREVMALRPVAYELKPEFNPTVLGEMPGLVAEEVAKVDERLVGLDPDGAVQGVRYMQMTAVLVKAIQEQQVQIDSLKAQVQTQQAMIDALPQFRTMPVGGFSDALPQFRTMPVGGFRSTSPAWVQ